MGGITEYTVRLVPPSDPSIEHNTSSTENDPEVILGVNSTLT